MARWYHFKDLRETSLALDSIRDISCLSNSLYVNIGSQEACLTYGSDEKSRTLMGHDYLNIKADIRLKEKYSNGVLMLRDSGNTRIYLDRVAHVGYNETNRELIIRGKNGITREFGYPLDKNTYKNLAEDFNAINDYLKKREARDEKMTSTQRVVIDEYYGGASGTYGLSGSKGTCGTYQPIFTKKKGNKVMDSIKEYFRKHEETIITIILIIMVDQFIFKGAFSEKLKAIVDGLINKVSKKVSE